MVYNLLKRLTFACQYTVFTNKYLFVMLCFLYIFFLHMEWCIITPTSIKQLQKSVSSSIKMTLNKNTVTCLITATESNGYLLQSNTLQSINNLMIYKNYIHYYIQWYVAYLFTTAASIQQLHTISFTYIHNYQFYLNVCVL